MQLGRDPRHDGDENEDRRQDEDRVGKVGIDQAAATTENEQPAQHRRHQKAGRKQRPRQ